MKDLAFMLSLWLFALKAGPMKDLASAMSGAVCPFCAIELTIVLCVHCPSYDIYVFVSCP